MNNKAFYLSFVFASTLACVIFSRFIFDLPTWSEEAGWLKIGKSFAAGERLNPIAPKSDYPSSFQAVPIGCLIAIGVQPKVASRSVAFVYAVIAAWFFGRLSLVFSKKDSIASLTAMVFSMLTYSTVLWVATGWHEVTHVNLLCGASLYFFVTLLDTQTKNVRNALALGGALGISLWTLYTPALLASVVLLLLAVLPFPVLSLRIRLYVLGSFLITATPVILGVITHNFEWLHRHYLWLLEGGEWENTKYSASNTFMAALAGTLRRIGGITIPQGSGESFDASIGIFPEWSLAILGVIGFGSSLFDLRKCVAITVPFVITTLILILSHATPWCASIVGFFIILYGAMGLGVLAQHRTIRRYKVILYGVVLGLHLLLCVTPIQKMLRVSKEAFVDGAIANDIAEKCGRTLLTETITAHDHSSAILLEAALSGTSRFQYVRQDTSAADMIRSPAGAALIISTNQTHPEISMPLMFQIMCRGMRHNVSWWFATLIADAAVQPPAK